MQKRDQKKHAFWNWMRLGMLGGGLLLAISSGCACSDRRQPEVKKTGAHPPVREEIAFLEEAERAKHRVEQAVARIYPFDEALPIRGQVVFKRVRSGIQIIADVEGLPPGEHGFHIHEFGDCHAGKAVGNHFNPTHQRHGAPDDPERHVGDLGNLIADESRHAHYERLDRVISFEGPTSILGRSIVIHAEPDDFVTQPAGNAGEKIACGVIEAIFSEKTVNSGKP